MHYSACIAHDGKTVSASFGFSNNQYALVPSDQEKYDKTLKLNGVALTKAGKELLSIIPINNAENYMKALLGFFESKYLKVVKINK